jgi:hypothetical protein
MDRYAHEASVTVCGKTIKVTGQQAKKTVWHTWATYERLSADGMTTPIDYSGKGKTFSAAVEDLRRQILATEFD